ncbi:AfsR/SARP family transcriptional regulator [Oerskovia enterophila]|uniref:AfsR/SARP family transcriptional regulator n=1 Tax=Oerskovia enterophila TaxID=43678 RepID=UPI00339AA0D8
MPRPPSPDPLGTVTLRVLGPTDGALADGTPLALHGPRHRALLGRLVAARGRTLPVAELSAALWGEDTPPRAVGAIRTFVGDLRQALEPDRRPRAPARVLTTTGDGYALLLPDDAVDGRRFERATDRATGLAPGEVERSLAAAIGLWRGTPYPEAGDALWAVEERVRLTELRDVAIERRAAALLALGRPHEATPLLRELLVRRPLRERASLLLARALDGSGRAAEALEALGAARSELLAVGLDPSRELDDLQTSILRHERPREDVDAFSRASEASTRITDAHSRLRLESTVALLRTLAVSGGTGLAEARSQRSEIVDAVDRLGDPALAARIIGGFDVPSIWPRSDDEDASAAVAAAALRALDELGPDSTTARARLLAVVAVELRGRRTRAGRASADESVRLARELGNPDLLCFALSAAVVQLCDRPGLSGERDQVAAEIVDLARRHDLPTFHLHGLLVRMQSATARGDLGAAASLASAVDTLADRHERPLARVFTRWNDAARAAARHDPSAEARYRNASELLDGAGMPGVAEGLLALALVGARADGARLDDLHAGAYDPWLAPLRHARAGETAAAAALLDDVPDPPPGLLVEALWSLVADAATLAAHPRAAERSCRALGPARQELAGGATGMLVLGPVADRLATCRPAAGPLTW